MVAAAVDVLSRLCLHAIDLRHAQRRAQGKPTGDRTYDEATRLRRPVQPVRRASLLRRVARRLRRR